MLLLGDKEVGKTGIVERYYRGKFPETYVQTIGVDFVILLLFFFFSLSTPLPQNLVSYSPTLPSLDFPHLPSLSFSIVESHPPSHILSLLSPLSSSPSA